MAAYENVFLEVIAIQEIGEGMRVCIDFVDILAQKEGLYVGNTGHGYMKVLSENRNSDGYPPRPFRINCGSFHQYLLQKDKTPYLHEIQPGEELVVTADGQDRKLTVGRVKMEKRAFLRVICKSEGEMISATLQNSTSVYLLKENNHEISIVDLKVGDRISCIKDSPGKHLGEKIDGVIIEK